MLVWRSVHVAWLQYGEVLLRWVQSLHRVHALGRVLAHLLTSVGPSSHVNVDFQRLVPLSRSVGDTELRLHVAVHLNVLCAARPNI